MSNDTQQQPQRTKSGQFQKKPSAESLAKAKTLTKETVLSAVAKDRANVDIQFNKISELTQEKLSELEIVTEAVDFQKSEIERLRGVETAALSIEEANLRLEATKSENARKLAEAKKDFESKLEEARIENNQKMQQFEIDRARIQSTWNYTFEQQKKAANDQLTEELRVARQQETVRKENLERGWQLREQELQSRENELAALRIKADSFDAEVKKAADAAESRAFSIAKKDKEHEIALLNNTHNAQRQVDQNTIQNLQAKVLEKDALISKLSEQLIDANKKVENIAVEGLKTAAARQGIADQQMLNQSNGANAPKRA